MNCNICKRNITIPANLGGVILCPSCADNLAHTALRLLAAVLKGNAKKAEVQRYVALILGLDKVPKPDDAADGLAVAICAANRWVMDNVAEAAKSLVEQFNRLYPVGSPVLLIKDLGEVVETTVKAFLITIDNWSKGNQSVYAAETAGKAKYQAYLAAYEAGIIIPITRFRAVRISRFDELAAQEERTCCIGWSVNAAGPYGRETWGCLANAVQSE